MPIPTTSTWRMADQLAEGNLGEVLVRLRDAGLPWRTIARRLHDEYRIDVTDVTLSLWHRQLTADEERAS